MDFTIDKLNLLVPITIIPAVGLLILSTSARFIHVNDVISKFTKEECNEHKIKVRRELKRANYFKNSLICSYLSIAIFLLHIYTSKDKPKNAEVAVEHRGYWFYIDETDMNTKLFYKVVRTLWSVTIASVTEKKSAPVLTLPVSR